MCRRVLGPDGTIRGDSVRLIDFDDPDNNDWLVEPFTVIEGEANRRPDVVIFVNGMPLGVIELKNPGDENATLDGAFNQLQTYKSQIASLFRTNAVLVISDGIAARIGSLTADRRTVHALADRDGRGRRPRARRNWRRCLRACLTAAASSIWSRTLSSFGDTGSDVAKILAGYHQFHAVRKAVEITLSATAAGGRPQGRGDLAHPRLRQEPPDGFLCGPDHQASGDAEPDCRVDRIATIWTTSCSGLSPLVPTSFGKLLFRPLTVTT